MNRNQTKPDSHCALCGAKRRLERSHIIPQFVYRWAKEASGNRRLPDGPSQPMLCRPCEDLFGFNESEFAREVFHPFAAGSLLSASYGAWLRKFAASVCWRILEGSRSEFSPATLPVHWEPALAACRESWRLYLIGKRPDVAGHHFHFLPWNAVSEVAGAGLHSIDMSVNLTDEAGFVYAKLGPILLVGLIADTSPTSWRYTRINAEGKLKPHNWAVPEYFRTFMLSQRPAGKLS